MRWRTYLYIALPITLSQKEIQSEKETNKGYLKRVRGAMVDSEEVSLQFMLEDRQEFCCPDCCWKLIPPPGGRIDRRHDLKVQAPGLKGLDVQRLQNAGWYGPNLLKIKWSCPFSCPIGQHQGFELGLSLMSVDIQ